MILIADGGSTKTSWCSIDQQGEKRYFNTEGYNPYFAGIDYIIASLKNNLPSDLPISEITEVNFYGAGCSTNEKRDHVKAAMSVVFNHAQVNVDHDLMAAARAVLGHNPGFAAILGTGTNTCLYNGVKITHNIDSGAYILGDEGSGCYIGKKVLTDYIRGYMPEAIRQSFWDAYHLTAEDVNNHVYTQPLASRFCAGFSKFVYDSMELDREYCYNIVKSSFQDFFKNLVTRYPDYQLSTFNCIGSVAYNFKDILKEVATANNMELGTIIRSPIDNLVKFHLEDRVKN